MIDSEKQYMSDPAFRAVATMAEKLVAEGTLSPEELRRAVMYGVYLYEIRRPGSAYFRFPDPGKKFGDPYR